MEPSLAWFQAWGDSWGSSWGPLHEVYDETDVIQVVGSCGGGYVDKRKERRLKQRQLEQEMQDEEEVMLIVTAFLKTCARNSMAVCA